MTGDRIFGAVMILVAGAYIASATTIQMPFFPDPVGPRTFPFLIAGGVIVCAGFMLVQPDADAAWPDRAALLRIAIAVGVMVVYAQLIKPLGFLIPTALAAGILSFMLRPKVLEALVIGPALAGGLYLLFRYALKLETLRAIPKDWLG